MGCLKLKGYAMIARTVILGVVTSYCGASVLLGAVEVEPFDENGFTNPFFDHEFEIDQPGVLRKRVPHVGDQLDEVGGHGACLLYGGCLAEVHQLQHGERYAWNCVRWLRLDGPT